MPIALSFHTDAFRVRIHLSGITPDGPVRVERATSPDGPWQTVRGGVQLAIVSGAAVLDDYEYVDGVENFYRIITLAESGLLLDGGSANGATTPDHPSLDITGDIDIRAELSADDWTTGLDIPVSKWGDDGLTGSYRFWRIGALRLMWSQDGTDAAARFEDSTVQPDAEDGQRLAIRATLDAATASGGHSVTFYTAPTLAGPWTQLGLVQSRSGPTSIFAGPAALEVGDFAGLIHAVEVRDGINGSVVANPSFDAQPPGTTSFSDSTGKLWTLQGTAQIVGDEVIEEGSITPDNGNVTVLKSIRYPALNRVIADPNYRPVQRASRAGLYNVKGRSTPTAVYDVYSSMYWTIETATDSLADARNLDLLLAAGGTYFVQVPAENENECFTNPVSGMPGGYVLLAESAQHHAVPGGHVMAWTLPVRVVAAPSPLITGGVLTWADAFALYGSEQAMWASNPTWRDVWPSINDPNDLVVLT